MDSRTVRFFVLRVICRPPHTGDGRRDYLLELDETVRREFREALASARLVGVYGR